MADAPSRKNPAMDDRGSIPRMPTQHQEQADRGEKIMADNDFDNDFDDDFETDEPVSEFIRAEHMFGGPGATGNVG
jgi:hypothetical protein